MVDSIVMEVTSEGNVRLGTGLNLITHATGTTVIVRERDVIVQQSRTKVVRYTLKDAESAKKYAFGILRKILGTLRATEIRWYKFYLLKSSLVDTYHAYGNICAGGSVPCEGADLVASTSMLFDIDATLDEEDLMNALSSEHESSDSFGVKIKPHMNPTEYMKNLMGE